ncbi:MAG: hypothetical protein EAZ20_08420 [Bacteroidetes bacterium]|nr:MAG: hypothetical protein EAZ20_08420 [Bacteroidota bacterium]
MVSKYKSKQSYSSFLDSLLKNDNIVVKDNIVQQKDTIFYTNEERKFENNYNILFDNFTINQKQISYSPKIDYIQFNPNLKCWSYFECSNGQRMHENKNRFCRQYFSFYDEKYPQHCGKYIQYKNNHFIYGVQAPPERCIGTGCRLRRYVIFTHDNINIYSSDFLEFPEDMLGLKFGDINNDGYLDFLDIKTESYDPEISKIFKETDGTCFYTLKVFTFKNGKFQYLKNQKGEEYYISYFIERPLDIKSNIHITDKKWIDKL